MGASIKFTDTTHRVIDAADKALFRNLFKAAGKVRRVSIASIKRSKSASSAGSPPNTRRGNLKRAILFDVDKSQRNAVIGPRYSIVGEAGAAHEFGEAYRNDSFPERPFMGPALDQASPDFAASFQGSIGN